MDVIHTAIKSISYNRYLALGILLPVVLGAAACSDIFMGEVESAITQRRSTAEEIQLTARQQIRILEDDISIKQAEVARLDAERNRIFAQAEEEIELANVKTEQNYAMADLVWTGISTNPAVQTALGAAGLGSITTMIGAIWDNRRKDKLLKKVKSPPEAAPASA